MRRALTLAVLTAGCLIAGPVVIPVVSAVADEAPTCFFHPATISGMSGTIVGTNGNDVIIGSPGNDTIYAGGGDDLVCGGGGDDRIVGGDGIDFLAGQDGADRLAGGPGNDLLYGEGVDENGTSLLPTCGDGAADRLDGEAGDDQIIDECGANQASGGTGHDNGLVTGTFDGGADDDDRDRVALPSTQFPGSAIEIVIFPSVTALESCPGCGNGRATGGSGDDIVGVVGGVSDGGTGDDLVEGGRSGDVVLGGLGADRLWDVSNTGGLRLDGGSGRDACELNGHTNDTVLRCEVVAP
jgi:hypothetical protein